MSLSQESRYEVLIAGNPNVGKTTIFNAITGSSHKVANYAGVTVEVRSATIDLQDLSVKIVDIPGIYSLSAESADEIIAIKQITKLHTDGITHRLVVLVADASNLKKNLLLASQIIELGFEVIIALNMLEIAESNGVKIYSELLSRQIDIPVIQVRQKSNSYDVDVSSLLNEIYNLLAKYDHGNNSRCSCCDTSQKNLNCLKLLEQAVERSTIRSETATQAMISSKLDNIFLHKVWGILIFVVIMLSMFQIIFSLAQIPTICLNWIISQTQNIARLIFPESWLSGLLIDGILVGIGSVLVFLPQIVLLYAIITLLEDSGYLARIVFLSDRALRLFGLQGRCFIPLLNSFGCTVPGILSTRIIPSISERIRTILVLPLISCSARIPIYTLIVSAMIPNKFFLGVFSFQALVMLCMYILGITTAVFTAFLFKLVDREPESVFAMELPRYKKPSISMAIFFAYKNGLAFIKNSGLIIISCSTIVWLLSHFPNQLPHKDGRNNNMPTTTNLSASYAGQIGKLVEPLIRPIGFDWRIGVALITSFVAREAFVSTLSTVYHLDEQSEYVLLLQESNIRERNLKSISKEPNQKEPNQKEPSALFRQNLDLPTALSIMVFCCFCCQCVPTLSSCKQETQSLRWPVLLFTYTMIFAYVGAFITYRVSRWLMC